MKHYFKELPEKRKKRIREEVLLIFMCDKNVKDPIVKKDEFLLSLERKPFDTKLKIRNWLWWNIGIKAEKAKEKLEK